MKKQLCAILSILLSCLLCGFASACSQDTVEKKETSGTGLSAATKSASSGPDFPRLGMWWLNAYAESAQAIARYDLLLDEFEGDGLYTKLKNVRKANPDIKVFRPLSPSERILFWENENGGNKPNPEIANLPSSFFLLEVGSTLARDVSKTDRYIYVTDMKYKNGKLKFRAGGEVAIGNGESAHITAVDVKNKRLKVQRGYVRAAAAHKKGEHIAMHIRFWPGTWVMNVTAACPRAKLKGFDKPVNYVEYVHALSVKQSWPGIYRYAWENSNYVDQARLHYDGLIIDRFEDHESWLSWISDDERIQIDLYHNNRAVSDKAFDASWQKGTDIYYSLLQKSFPGLPVIRNNPQTVRFDAYNGQVYETGGWSDPDARWWRALFVETCDGGGYKVGCYMDWFEKGTKRPQYVMVEVYEDEEGPESGSDGEYSNPFDEEGFTPDYRRMRFSLCSTLLGDGYYSYEINTNGHGTLGLMWFDEYDNAGAGRGWLGQPVGAYVSLDCGAYYREFEGGLALVNPQGHAVTIDLPQGNWQRINGRQCPEVNNGQPAGKTVTLNAFDGLLLARAA